MWPYGPETSLCLLILIQPIATMNPMDESPLLGEGFSALDGDGIANGRRPLSRERFGGLVRNTVQH